ncbi:hypothetical protein D3C74_296700 [compost metagenome]
MIFTRRTYRVAIRRSIAKEAMLHGEHAACFRGPEAWYAQINHTRKLQARKRKERK